MQRQDFLAVGKLIATSILQGGDGFPVVLPALYDYISMGTYSADSLDTSMVPDPLVKNLLQQVRQSPVGTYCSESI